jgi:hypothetical protein
MCLYGKSFGKEKKYNKAHGTVKIKFSERSSVFGFES